MFLNIINYIYIWQAIKITQEKGTGTKKHTEKGTEKPQLNV